MEDKIDDAGLANGGDARSSLVIDWDNPTKSALESSGAKKIVSPASLKRAQPSSSEEKEKHSAAGELRERAEEPSAKRRRLSTTALRRSFFSNRLENLSDNDACAEHGTEMLRQLVGYRTKRLATQEADRQHAHEFQELKRKHENLFGVAGGSNSSSSSASSPNFSSGGGSAAPSPSFPRFPLKGDADFVAPDHLPLRDAAMLCADFAAAVREKHFRRSQEEHACIRNVGGLIKCEESFLSARKKQLALRLAVHEKHLEQAACASSRQNGGGSSELEIAREREQGKVTRAREEHAKAGKRVQAFDETVLQVFEQLWLRGQPDHAPDFQTPRSALRVEAGGASRRSRSGESAGRSARCGVEDSVPKRSGGTGLRSRTPKSVHWADGRKSCSSGDGNREPHPDDGENRSRRISWGNTGSSLLSKLLSPVGRVVKRLSGGLIDFERAGGEGPAGGSASSSAANGLSGTAARQATTGGTIAGAVAPGQKDPGDGIAGPDGGRKRPRSFSFGVGVAGDDESERLSSSNGALSPASKRRKPGEQEPKAPQQLTECHEYTPESPIQGESEDVELPMWRQRHELGGVLLPGEEDEELSASGSGEASSVSGPLLGAASASEAVQERGAEEEFVVRKEGARVSEERNLGAVEPVLGASVGEEKQQESGVVEKEFAAEKGANGA
eukprot:g9436.t1